jgi:hypothetical protein
LFFFLRLNWNFSNFWLSIASRSQFVGSAIGCTPGIGSGTILFFDRIIAMWEKAELKSAKTEILHFGRLIDYRVRRERSWSP